MAEQVSARVGFEWPARWSVHSHVASICLACLLGASSGKSQILMPFIKSNSFVGTNSWSYTLFAMRWFANGVDRARFSARPRNCTARMLWKSAFLDVAASRQIHGKVVSDVA